MNTEINKGKEYSGNQKLPTIKKTTEQDKIALNLIFAQIINNIKDKHLG
jgi:hypothetical protein